jgi:hypothetical protein
MTTALSYAIALATSLEGGYKWYIVTGIVFILSALITRFIFKTIKWFVMIVLLGILVAGLTFYVRSHFA